jgi:1-deoxy-D-xylulose-5-phosphate synthase
MHTLAEAQLLDGGLKLRAMVLPDVFIDHGHPLQMYELAGLNASNIVRTAMAALGEVQARKYRIAAGLPTQSVRSL